MIHAPSEQIGLEMTLLRMIAFHSKNEDEKKTLKTSPKAKAKTTAKVAVKQKNEKKPVAKDTTPSKVIRGKAEAEADVEAKPVEVADTKTNSTAINNQADWEALIQQLPFKGATKMLVKNTIFDRFKENKLALILDSQFSNVLTNNTQKEIETTLRKHFNEIDVSIVSGETNNKSLAQKENIAEKAQREELETNYLNDEGVKALEKALNTKVDVKSIKPLQEDLTSLG